MNIQWLSLGWSQCVEQSIKVTALPLTDLQSTETGDSLHPCQIHFLTEKRFESV